MPKTKTLHTRSRPKPAGEPLAVRLADAAAVVGISSRGLANLIARGELKAVRRGPRIVLIPMSELKRLTDPEAA